MNVNTTIYNRTCMEVNYTNMVTGLIVASILLRGKPR